MLMTGGPQGFSPLWLVSMALALVATGVVATMMTTQWGARLAHSIDARMLRRLFALFLTLTSARRFYALLSVA